MSQQEEEYSAARPQACPFCGVQREFEESITHDQRDNGDLEFLWECPECGNQFTTVNQLEVDPTENHTFMWVHDEDDGDVVQFIHIHGGEENTGVKAKRAELNMMGGQNYEVHGRDWAIQRLFEVFDEQFDLPEESEGPLEISWLDEEDAESES